MHRMRQLESDWFWHQAPVYLKGGKVIKWDNPDEVYAAIQINVNGLGVIQPFTRYRLMVRRHVPVEVLGLPLKFKVVGNVPFNPQAYSGFSREVFNNEGREVLTGDALSQTPDEHGHGGWDRDDVEVIHREVLAEIFPAIMFGFGNTATVDDVMRVANEPRPFIELYVNDEGRFVIMPTRCEQRRRRGLVIRDVEVTTMPFTAKTLEIQRNMTEFVHPESHRSGELFVQGSFGRGDMNRGFGGSRNF